jgi:predicted dehydrogenase
MSNIMRVALVGVSHWHTDLYAEPVADDQRIEIVGVSDPGVASAERWAARLGTTAFADYRQMCEKNRPDLVFALGRHIDMPELARHLVDARIHFVMEKPCGVSVADVVALRDLAADRGAFVSVPFSYRYSDLRRLIGRLAGTEELRYGMFRLVPGSVSRYYDWGVEWNLDPMLAGGGCTLNLSVHFFDLVRVLAPSASWRIAAASMSNALGGAGVEDYSAVLLEADGRRAVVETGYAAAGTTGDAAMSVYTDSHHFRLDGNTGNLVVVDSDGEQTVYTDLGQQRDHYADFVRDTIERVREGEPPPADLSDMVEAAALAESAYRCAGDDKSMTNNVMED